MEKLNGDAEVVRTVRKGGGWRMLLHCRAAFYRYVAFAAASPSRIILFRSFCRSWAVQDSGQNIISEIV